MSCDMGGLPRMPLFINSVQVIVQMMGVLCRWQLLIAHVRKEFYVTLFPYSGDGSVVAMP